MAISNAVPMHPLRNEIEYLRDRIRSASSGAEARHYEERLHRLEREMYNRRYDINTDSYVDAQRYMMQVNTTPIPEPQTPLSFLKNADTKLLLTGATS
jgi:hypothetical protein